jgi:hypothetical protein
MKMAELESQAIDLFVISMKSETRGGSAYRGATFGTVDGLERLALRIVLRRPTVPCAHLNLAPTASQKYLKSDLQY